MGSSGTTASNLNWFASLERRPNNHRQLAAPLQTTFGLIDRWAKSLPACSREKLPDMLNFPHQARLASRGTVTGNRYVVPYAWGSTGIGFNGESDSRSHARCARRFLGDHLRSVGGCAIRDCGVAFVDSTG